MFDIGFPELILVAVIGLLVIGPERLPEALRTLGLWVGRMRRSFTNVKAEIEKEIGMDEIRRQLHNEAVMEEMKRIERDVRSSFGAQETRADQPAEEHRIAAPPAAPPPQPPEPTPGPVGDVPAAAANAPAGSVAEHAPHAAEAPQSHPDRERHG